VTPVDLIPAPVPIPRLRDAGLEAGVLYVPKPTGRVASASVRAQPPVLEDARQPAVVAGQDEGPMVRNRCARGGGEPPPQVQIHFHDGRELVAWVIAVLPSPVAQRGVGGSQLLELVEPDRAVGVVGNRDLAEAEAVL